jgi:uncharacterized protein (TIGR03437 family)
MACAENGVQTYAAEVDGNNLKNIVYSTIPDSTPAGGTAQGSAEQPYFKGLIADTVSLDTRDSQLATGPNESIVVMANGSLMKMGSQPKLIKGPGQNPTGNVQQVVKVGTQIVFLLGGRAFYVYQPQPQTPVSGRQRDDVKISCRDCVPGGRVPSFQLRIAGQDVPYGVSSTGEISFTVPSNAPTGTYEGTVNVSGLLKTVVVNVRPSTEPATPTITRVTTPSGGTGPFAPRSTVVIAYTGDPGKRETAGIDASFKLADVSGTCDGNPLRIKGNSGNGYLTAILPASAGQNNQCNLVIRVEGGGVTVESSPYRINLAAVSNSLFTSFDFSTGQQMPQLSSAGESQNGPAGSDINPLTPGSKIRAFGTGCGTANISDGENVPEPGIDAGEATIQIGSEFVAAKTTIAPLVPGLCFYDFIAPNLSGPQNFGFVGSPEFFSVRFK